MDKVKANEFVPMFNRVDIRQGEIPSGNGSCSARGLAKIGSCIVNGGSLDGKQILKPETIEKMHGNLVRKSDYGIGGMKTEFSQGGVNLYK